jgi:glycosyltransferase involved in cell wall biosynthesis
MMQSLQRHALDYIADTSPLVSIIIDNYNYGRFLVDAIDSALAQTHRNTEVIVVDDGSTDDSREIITSYASRVRPVFKANGGQASAFNAGFAVSRGDVILFLDSDDMLCPTAVETVLPLFRQPQVSKVHWPLWLVDEGGRRIGGTRPGRTLLEGDLRDRVLQCGPSSCPSAPTSGNAWARWFLEEVLPAPEDVSYYRVCADEYLFTLAPVFGPIKAIDEPQGRYRLHGNNVYSAKSFRDQLRLELEGYAQQAGVFSRILRAHGIDVDTEQWKRHSWFYRLDESLREVESLTAGGNRVILVDDQTWGVSDFLGGRQIGFLEKDGEYWGAPADDETAIRELELLRERGAAFFILAWPSFWWLDHYAAFHAHLRTHFECVQENDRLIVFDLRLRKACDTERNNGNAEQISLTEKVS